MKKKKNYKFKFKQQIKKRNLNLVKRKEEIERGRSEELKD